MKTHRKLIPQVLLWDAKSPTEFGDKKITNKLPR
jgi:hypothetical protein